MPDYNQHMVKADSNIGFVQFLISEKRYEDWAVTGCFYSAVHLIEMAIYCNSSIKFDGADIKHSSDIEKRFPKATPVPSSPHAMRKRIVESNQDYFGRDFLRAYRTLERLSKESRYMCYEIDEDYLKAAVDDVNVVIKHINAKERSDFPEITMP